MSTKTVDNLSNLVEIAFAALLRSIGIGIRVNNINEDVGIVDMLITDARGINIALVALKNQKLIFPLEIQIPDGEYLENEELRKIWRSLDIVVVTNNPSFIELIDATGNQQRIYLSAI